MADQHNPPPHPAPSEPSSKSSPPLTPPDADLNGADHRQSRKREREVSLEPANTPKAPDADGARASEVRDTRTPAKRNKRSLESTTEEAEEASGKTSSRSRSRSHSVSPPLGVGVSPRQEIRIKVRQISQGVEELNWKTPKALDKNQHATEIVAPQILAPPAEVDEKAPETQDAVITDVKDNDSQQATQQEARGKDTAVEVEGVEEVSASANVTLAIPTQEKGLKRRFEERGTSQGPGEGEGTSTTGPEPLKRPRDDGGEDPNPREAKRISPPPETAKVSPKPLIPSPKAAAPKPTGFLAYASVSPFAQAAKNPNIFSSGKNTPASVFASPVPSTSHSSITSTPADAPSSPPKGVKRSGFEAFASSSSPFSSVGRSKSPVLGQTSKLGRAKSPPARSNSVSSNPFASYLGNNQGFAAAHSSKRLRAESPPESTQSSLDKNSSPNILNPNGTQSSEEEEEAEVKRSTFGEKLRATRDEDEDSNRSEEDPKVTLTEQEVVTGEEDEITMHQVRAKLFSLESGQWKERGVGTLKLNVKEEDGTGARLVMRKDAVYTLLLNVTLFPGMSCTLSPDPRYVRFSAIEDGSTTHYNLRLGSAKAAQDLLREIQRTLMNLPPA